MTNTALLNMAIRKSGLKKSYLADKIGLSPAGFCNCLNNRAEFKASQINILCDLLGIKTLEEKEKIFFAENGG